MKQINDADSLNKLIQDYFVKNTITNNYVLAAAYNHFIEDQKLYYISSAENLCILVKKSSFYRLYYFINNQDELMKIECDLPVVMEIIYRGEIQKPIETMAYWEKCGFVQHLTRDNMVANYAQLSLPESRNSNVELKYADTINEINFTQELIEKTLDKFTGDILSYEEVRAFANNRNILCAYWEDKLAGILQFEIKNNIVWLGHIAVDTEYRGKGIANELVKAYISFNALQSGTRYQLWVIQNNTGAIALYQKFGFIYGNKSSVSMLKNN